MTTIEELDKECDQLRADNAELRKDLALWQSQGQSNDLVDEHRALQEENYRLKEELKVADEAMMEQVKRHTYANVRAEEAEKLLEETEACIERYIRTTYSPLIQLIQQLRARKEGNITK